MIKKIQFSNKIYYFYFIFIFIKKIFKPLFLFFLYFYFNADFIKNKSNDFILKLYLFSINLKNNHFYN